MAKKTLTPKKESPKKEKAAAKQKESKSTAVAFDAKDLARNAVTHFGLDDQHGGFAVQTGRLLRRIKHSRNRDHVPGLETITFNFRTGNGNAQSCNAGTRFIHHIKTIGDFFLQLFVDDHARFVDRLFGQAFFTLSFKGGLEEDDRVDHHPMPIAPFEIRADVTIQINAGCWATNVDQSIVFGRCEKARLLRFGQTAAATRAQ